MGLSTYGQSWTLLSTTNNVPPAPANGPGVPRPYTGEKGIYSYYEICLNIKENGWMVVRDPQGQMGPYAYTRLNLSWVGYDDASFATVKANYIISKGLGKAMVWDISLDDFANLCADGAGINQPSTTTTIAPSTTTTTSLTTTSIFSSTTPSAVSSTSTSTNIRIPLLLFLLLWCLLLRLLPITK